MRLQKRLACLLSLILLLTCALLLSDASAQVQYSVTDLGTVGGSQSYVTGINNNGQVVGYSFTAGDQNYHAFLYKDGVMVDLRSFGGVDSIAKGITTLSSPGLTIACNGNSITLTWPAGVLQQADSLLGPFSDVTGSTSPYTTPATGLRKYYRLR